MASRRQTQGGGGGRGSRQTEAAQTEAVAERKDGAGKQASNGKVWRILWHGVTLLPRMATV